MVVKHYAIRQNHDLAMWTATKTVRLWLLWLIGTVVASLPLLAVRFPPLDQHFFNVVRIQILADPAAYARDFVIQWDVVPDLALDLTIPWMAGFISVEQATRLVVLVTLALLTSGTLILSRVVNRRWSLLPLISFLFLYNWILVRGYENNLLGLGLSLWALAAHFALRRSMAARALVSSCSALILYFCHLFPLGVFALVVGTWELSCLLQEGLSRPRVLGHTAVALVPFAVPMLLLWLSSTSGLGGVIEFGVFQIWTKMKLCVEALTVGNRVSDIVLLASLGGTVAVAAARGWLQCEPECRVTVVALPLVALLAPLYAFASWGVVERCGLSFAFLLVALLGQRLADLQWQRVVGVALALVFLFRIGTITADWRTADHMIQAYRAVFASLEPGSVLFQFDQDTSYPSPIRDPHRWNPPLDKIVALATLNGVLVPELYLKAGQQPVLYRATNASLRAFQYDSDQRQIASADDAMLRAWVAELSKRFPDLQIRFRAVYVAVYDPHRRLSTYLPGGQLVAALPEHHLYKLSLSPS